ncbi:MAG: hypothetical protein K4571_07220 [Deltaproteobacteria bacterium]
MKEFLMLIMAIALCAAPAAGYAQKPAANANTGRISTPDLYPRTLSEPTVMKSSAGSSGLKGFNVHIWNNNRSAGSTAGNSPASYSGKTRLLQRAAGFTHSIFSFHPLAAGDANAHLRDIFTFANLNTLLSFRSIALDDIRNGMQLSELLKVSHSFENSEYGGLTADLSARRNGNNEDKAVTATYDDATLKSFIHNPFHDRALSIYLPISLSRSLTIVPAITYAYSTNNMNRQEFREKGLVNNLIDKNSAIVYGGIHLRYLF